MSNRPSHLQVPGQIQPPPSMRSPGVPYLANKTEAALRHHLEFGVRVGRLDPTDDSAMEAMFKVLADQSITFQGDALAAQLVALEIESWYRVVTWRESRLESSAPENVDALVLATKDGKLADAILTLVEEYMKNAEQETPGGQEEGPPGTEID